MNDANEIYVSLLDEGVDVRRPARARHLHGDVFRIESDNPQSDDENWQFKPGETVVCEMVEGSDGPILAAVRRNEE